MTDGRINRPTDGRTDPVREMLGCIQKRDHKTEQKTLLQNLKELSTLLMAIHENKYLTISNENNKADGKSGYKFAKFAHQPSTPIDKKRSITKSSMQIHPGHDGRNGIGKVGEIRGQMNA